MALTASGRLISFDRTAPGTALSTVAVTGIASGETLLDIDRRLADGLLYALGSAGNIYTLDPLTGVATFRSALRPVSGDDNPFTALSGTGFGIDFNPINDRLRIISDSGQNLQVNVDTGAATTDPRPDTLNLTITAIAYTDGFFGANTTGLTGLDVATGRFYSLDPDSGTIDRTFCRITCLDDAGVPFGVTATASKGYDIDPRTNTGYAALRVDGEVALYVIQRNATRVGAIAGGEDVVGIALAAVATPVAIGLTSDNRLVSFDPRTPNTIAANVAVTGLAAGESLQGVDFRPADQRLYGVTSAGRLYTIDPATGVATVRATLFADPSDNSDPFVGFSGSLVTVDFNPSTDELRLITSSGQNLRVIVADATVNGTVVAAGATTTDPPINRAGSAPSIVASAHSNNHVGATGSGLRNIEQNSDQLTLQSPINSGTLSNLGALGIDVSGPAGFDIAGGNNGLALAALRTGGTGPFSLYTISLGSGAANLYNGATDPTLSVIGGAGGPTNLIDLAIRL